MKNYSLLTLAGAALLGLASCSKNNSDDSAGEAKLDFSTDGCRRYEKSVFIHEMTHVWQNQNVGPIYLAHAVFGQATWTPPVLDGIAHLTLGARYSRDKKKGALTKVNGAG